MSCFPNKTVRSSYCETSLCSKSYLFTLSWAPTWCVGRIQQILKLTLPRLQRQEHQRQGTRLGWLHLPPQQIGGENINMHLLELTHLGKINGTVSRINVQVDETKIIHQCFIGLVTHQFWSPQTSSSNLWRSPGPIHSPSRLQQQQEDKTYPAHVCCNSSKKMYIQSLHLIQYSDVHTYL